MKTWLRVLTLAFTLVLIVLSGTVFFHHVEGWSWLDSYFFSVVTLSTVGYGSIVPETAAGKIGTTIYIFIGLGVFAVAIQQIGAFAMRKREEHIDRLHNLLFDDRTPANTDDAPEDGK
jgi:voltage-gated potassium channel